jgi:hypothetical protein
MKLKAMLGALAVCAVAAGLLATAAADPVSMPSGKAILPTTGLVIDVPAKAGVIYKISASWSLTDDGVFDSRDVIDEFSGNDIVAGNWALIGYFDAGACDKVLASEKLDKSWTAKADLWGAIWNIRGGIFTFSGSLGRRPAALLCRDDADGRTFLLYRFLISYAEDTITQAATLADLRTAAVLERASHAYDARRMELVAPIKRAEVTNRGKIAAARQVKLTESKLTVDLPDDGYVWLANPGDGADVLDRMAPFFPETTFDIAALEGVNCAEVFEAASATMEKKPGRAATNLPAGWVAGPAVLFDGKVELLTCRGADYGALVVGLFLDREQTDAGEFHPILAALAAAKRTP